MVKSLTLILGAMVIVFSLTLIGGGVVSVFYLAQDVNLEKSIRPMLFYGGGLVLLVGLAGFLAGLVGIIGSVILKASETAE